MAVARQMLLMARGLPVIAVALLPGQAQLAAQTLAELRAGGKKESELTFVAGPTPFGGRHACADLQAAFNKRFGLSARISFTAGPSMPAMAARLSTEAKAGRNSSSDINLGPP